MSEILPLTGFIYNRKKTLVSDYGNMENAEAGMVVTREWTLCGVG